MKAKAPRHQEKYRNPGRMAERYSQAKRLLQLLELFHLNRRTGLTYEQITEKYEISYRTAERDIRALEEIGIPLYYEIENKVYVWKLVEGYRYCGLPSENVSTKGTKGDTKGREKFSDSSCP